MSEVSNFSSSLTIEGCLSLMTSENQIAAALQTMVCAGSASQFQIKPYEM